MDTAAISPRSPAAADESVKINVKFGAPRSKNTEEKIVSIFGVVMKDLIKLYVSYAGEFESQTLCGPCVVRGAALSWTPPLSRVPGCLAF